MSGHQAEGLGGRKCQVRLFRLDDFKVPKRLSVSCWADQPRFQVRLAHKPVDKSPWCLLEAVNVFQPLPSVSVRPGLKGGLTGFFLFVVCYLKQVFYEFLENVLCFLFVFLLNNNGKQKHPSFHFLTLWTKNFKFTIFSIFISREMFHMAPTCVIGLNCR